MRTYLISCDELPERRDAARDHLRERGINHPWGLPGIHGNTWTLDTRAEYEPGKRISAGHVSLLLNHWIAWGVADQLSRDLQSTLPWLFLEDDAVLPPDWETQHVDLCARLNRDMPDWEFCFVGLAESPPGCWHKVTERIGGPESPLCRLNDPFGTHAYLVQPRALAKLIKHFPGDGARRNADQQLFRNVLAPGHVNWCAVLPTIVTQRTFDYTGSGVTEWGPSCVDPAQTPPDNAAGYAAAVERDAKTHAAPRVAENAPGASHYERTLALVDPVPCIYRGESRDEHGHVRGDPNGRVRTVPVYDCTRLGVACHTNAAYPVVHLNGSDATAIPCRDCTIRTEMPSGPRERLNLPDGHFNPSIVEWHRRLLLATRDSWGHSRVALWWLDNSDPAWRGVWTARAIGSYAAEHVLAPRLEDPRLFIAAAPDGTERVHAAFNLPDGYPPKRVRVGYVRFAADLSGIEHTAVMQSPLGCAYEKNWSPFWDAGAGEGEVRWIYGMKPHHVVLRDSAHHTNPWVTPNDLPWVGGVMRGGAAPIRVGDEYWTFFHGCLKRFQGSVYTTGCYAFDTKPPYRILRQTRTPLVWPDLPAPGESVVKRYVVWPGGAVLRAGTFHVAHGIDDTYVRMIRLSYSAVDAAMTDTPGDAGVSIRETPLARGVNADEVSGCVTWCDFT